MNRLGLVLLLLFASAGANAAAPAGASTYEVEILIFESRLPELEGDEQWVGGTKTEPETVSAVTLGNKPSGSDLAAAGAALQNDPRYRLLLHRRWIQSADGRTASTPVSLRTEGGELSGHLRFYMSRFMHLELSVAFQPQVAALGGVDPAPPAYHLSEQRRVRSQELHYFDHPKFGALVRVVPATATALGAER